MMTFLTTRRTLALCSVAALVLALGFPAQADDAVLRQGTEVVVRPARDLRSDREQSGDTVEFVVDAPVRVGTATLLPAGATVLGVVTRAVDSDDGWRPGELRVAVVIGRAADGRWVGLRAEPAASGGDGDDYTPPVVGAIAGGRYSAVVVGGYIAAAILVGE
ncbi:MAG: hypothetical protein FJX76_04335 [Armatimonadetes bacterium]|nr:hypothetical protein [Armatimonadota bacterium]